MTMTLARNTVLGCGAALVLAGFASTALAEDAEIRIVNLTRGQIFSPVIAWSHNKQFEPFFEFGGQASEELRAIAAPLAGGAYGDYLLDLLEHA